MRRYNFHFHQIIIPEPSSARRSCNQNVRLLPTWNYMTFHGRKAVWRCATSPWVGGCSTAVLYIPFFHGGFSDFAQTFLNVCLSWQPIIHSKRNKGKWSNQATWQKLRFHGCERYWIFFFFVPAGKEAIGAKWPTGKNWVKFTPYDEWANSHTCRSVMYYRHSDGYTGLVQRY